MTLSNLFLIEHEQRMGSARKPRTWTGCSGHRDSYWEFTVWEAVFTQIPANRFCLPGQASAGVSSSSILRVTLCPGAGKAPPMESRRLSYSILWPTFGSGFCRLKIRPRFCSSEARNASSPSGRPVCSWARRTFRSSSRITRVKNRRQSGRAGARVRLEQAGRHVHSGAPRRCSSDTVAAS